MYSVKNSAPTTHATRFSISITATIKLLAVLSMIAAVPVALYVRVDSKSSKTAISSRPEAQWALPHTKE